MMNMMKCALPLAMTVVLSACGGKHEEGDHHHHADSTSHEHLENRADTGADEGKVRIKDDHLNAVYPHYLRLTTALIGSDAGEAQIAASAIEAGLAGHAEGAAVAQKASEITKEKDIEAQRTLYSALSDDFIKLVRKSGLAGGELYIDFCPMANADKGGYWLAAQQEIENPYMGEKMLSCGKVEETLH